MFFECISGKVDILHKALEKCKGYKPKGVKTNGQTIQAVIPQKQCQVIG